ncbi:MAG: isoprenylcysteine carboxylmethyltransferase family protein [Thermoleophilia bacterium]|nr:isoprenylcysteine carboxylmethyltransferase family protein [Thermoleophilia bacterium]
MPEAPTLGRRGGGWVVLQLALMGAIGLAAALGPRWPSSMATALALAGAAVGLVGIVVGLAAGRALGRSLTPFPRPRQAAELVERGPYRVVRHPLYSAGLLLGAGISLASSPLALAATVALALLWAAKASVEERFLRERYPGYAAYARRVRWRLVPYVY